MGLLCGKLRCCLCCCRCCSNATLAAMPTTRPTHYKALLLGSSGSGKTELGHLLSGRPRDVDDQEQTNGVRCYRCRRRAPQDVELALTEVGGNADMQRLWPHYYASTHALIYCFNLAAGYAELQASFELLQRCLRHEALRGKAVLLVATRLSEGVQLYDVEHAFGLEALARSCGCPLHLCHLAEIADATDVWRGMDWLQRQLLQQSTTLLQRIKYDVNMQSWQQRSRAILSSGKLAQVRRQRFRRQHRKLWPLASLEQSDSLSQSQTRPRTAPAKIFYIRAQDAVRPRA